MWDGTADNLPPEWLGAADAVTCHMRISEYLRDEQTAAHFFQAAAALLKPGGLLYGVMLDQAAVWTAAQKGKVEVKGQGQKTRSRAFTLFLESDSFEPEYFGTPFLLRAEDGLGDKVAHFLGHIPSIVAVAEVRTLRSLGAAARWSTRLAPPAHVPCAPMLPSLTDSLRGGRAAACPGARMLALAGRRPRDG